MTLGARLRNSRQHMNASARLELSQMERRTGLLDRLARVDA